MKENKRRLLHRVITFLDRKELEFIDRLSKDAMFSTGFKLPRVKIISAIIDAVITMDISARGINCKKELVQRIVNALYTQKDRRKYPRFKKHLSVGLRKMDSLGKYKSSVTDNVSMGGFKIDLDSLDEALTINQVIEITVNNPVEKVEPIKAIGRIVWLREKENKQGLEVGVIVTYIRKEDKERFVNYLNEEIEIKNEIKQEGLI